MRSQLLLVPCAPERTWPTALHSTATRAPPATAPTADEASVGAERTTRVGAPVGLASADGPVPVQR